MLKIKLFRAFAALIIAFSVLSSVIGIRMIRQKVIREAQTRVRLDLSSAWAEVNNRLDEITIVLRAVSGKQALLSAMDAQAWDDISLRERLEAIRIRENLDFLDVISTDGRVVMRATRPYNTNDSLISEDTVADALKGTQAASMSLLSGSQLDQEGEGLEEQAFLELDDTPRSRRSPATEESRGLVMAGAVPIEKGGKILGAVYGGILVNRNHGLVDRIHDVVYRNEEYNGTPMGTATFFLRDRRVATTVRMKNGNRALGTKASKEVADHVLDNGKPWIGEAFVVKDWYLTAYDPIRNGRDEIIGMLYVGILKKPFDMYARSLALRYLFLTLFALLAALILAFIMAGRLAQPIHRLVEASNSMSEGRHPGIVSSGHACRETGQLIKAFNSMTATLAEREEHLKAVNRNYMETLGFVSHELKGPVGTIMNYSYLLHEQKIGPLSEKQLKAAKSMEAAGKRLAEMVRHYLNLSRIENGELQPVPLHVPVVDEILTPLLVSLEPDLRERRMRVENHVEETVLRADPGMVREVFENIVENAVKYGQEEGTISIRCSRTDGLARFSIRNDGEGIPREKMSDLFQKFSRIGSSATREKKGTGLGLFITKQIVELHGGSIEAASEEGKWTQFSFTFPLAEIKDGEKT